MPTQTRRGVSNSHEACPSDGNGALPSIRDWKLQRNGPAKLAAPPSTARRLLTPKEEAHPVKTPPRHPMKIPPRHPLKIPPRHPASIETHPARARRLHVPIVVAP